jgi:anti-sigma B factor antagonist
VSELASVFVWRRENVVVAAITGEIDVSNARRLEASIAGAIDNQSPGLVLDLAGLEFMDSSAVHMLFELARRMRLRRRGFALVMGEESAPRRVLELSGPEPMQWVHPTEEAAIAAVLATA